MTIGANTPKVTLLFRMGLDDSSAVVSLKSAIQQSYPSLEILVLANGTISKSIASLIESNPARVALVKSFEPLRATGDYVSLVDDRCVLDPDKISREVQVITAIPGDRTVLYGDHDVLNSDRTTTYSVRHPGIRPEQFRYALLKDNAVEISAMLFPRSALERLSLSMPQEPAETFDFLFSTAQTYRFVHLPDCSVSTLPAQMTTKGREALESSFCSAVGALTAADLQFENNSSAQRAYLELSQGLQHRGFDRAAKTAARLSLTANGTTLRGSAAAILNRLSLVSIAPNQLRQFAQKGAARLIASQRPMGSRKPQSQFDLRARFVEIYRENLFQGDESRSGEGSNMVQTSVIRNELPNLVRDLEVSSFLDAPCGDWYWMKECTLGVREYIGVDIVPDIIEKNRNKFGGPGVKFECMNVAKDKLPTTDLVFTRDCLEHLSFSDALSFVENIKRSGAKYFVTTTFTERAKNFDLGESIWRPLNKQLPPFNFPPPIRLINEHCTEGNGLFADKCLGVWNLEEL